MFTKRFFQTLMKTKKGTLGLMNAFNQMMHPEPPVKSLLF